MPGETILLDLRVTARAGSDRALQLSIDQEKTANGQPQAVRVRDKRVRKSVAIEQGEEAGVRMETRGQIGSAWALRPGLRLSLPNPDRDDQGRNWEDILPQCSDRARTAGRLREFAGSVSSWRRL